MQKPARSVPVGTSVGTLGETPLVNALIFVRGRQLAGALELDAGPWGTAVIVFARGLIVGIALRPRERSEAGTSPVERATRDLEQVLRFPPETTYVFSELSESDAIEGSPEPILDPILPVWRTLRAAGQSPPVDVTLRLAASKVALTGDVGLAASCLTRDERAILDTLIEGPCTFAELKRRTSLPPSALALFVHLLVVARCAHAYAPTSRPPAPATATVPAPPPTIVTAAVDAPTRKVPKWRSFELALTDLQAQLADAEPALVDRVTTRVGPKSPAELGPDGIRERAARIAFETPHAALGLPEGAPLEAARAAYVDATRGWHPHRLAPELEHVSAEVACVYMHMVEAYCILSDGAGLPATGTDERRRSS